MGFAIELTDEQWGRVADLFDPPGRRGRPPSIGRRQMVDAMLFLARTGCQWRYLPDRYRPVGRGLAAVAALAANGVWERRWPGWPRRSASATSASRCPRWS